MTQQMCNGTFYLSCELFQITKKSFSRREIMIIIKDIILYIYI